MSGERIDHQLQIASFFFFVYLRKKKRKEVGSNYIKVPKEKINEGKTNEGKTFFTKMLNFSKGSFFKKTGSTIKRLTGSLITGLTSLV